MSITIDIDPELLQKAQAALTRRGYSDLAGGWTKDSFRQLLGTNPVRVSAHAPIDDYVIGHLRSKTPAAISTLSNTTAPAAVTRRMAELDIKHNHYYVPVGLTGDGPSATVKLFNPWGDSHPRRELSRDDLRLIFHGIDTPDDYIRF